MSNFDPRRASASIQQQIERGGSRVIGRGSYQVLTLAETLAEIQATVKKPAKYRNVRTPYTSPLIGPRTYDSRKEADFAATLDQWRAAGLISFWLPQQPRWPLPGGSVHVVDFMTVSDGKVAYYEVKGRDLAAGKMKRKMVEALFGVEIIVV